MKLALIVLGLSLLTPFVRAGESCNGPAQPSRADLPGSPFKIAVSSDGCTVFASLTGQDKKKVVGIAVLRRQQGSLSLVRTIKTSTKIWGLVITHDGRTLIATDGKGAALFDIDRMLSGQGNPSLGSIAGWRGSLSVYANLTADDRTLFISNENRHSITVIDLPTRKMLGRIEVGILPIALTFSPDGRWLYTTSQTAAPGWHWPNACDSERLNDHTHKHPHGAIVVIDVALARTAPSQAIAARVEAGCNPVRFALSPSGDRAYVTARKDNTLLVFDPAKFLTDATHAKIAAVPVGVAPVPVLPLPDGRRIVVGNSNRFGEKAGEPDLNVIDAATYKVSGRIPSGKFPRDLVLSPDGRTLYVASFGSSAIDIFDVDRLPVSPPE